MKYDDKTYSMFLEEIHELENFRLTYAAGHPATPLDSDDPDVRRLIEAMAFFSARTHTAGLRNIAATRKRLFRQFFPFLLTPMPSMGIFQVKPTGQFAEPVLLPGNSEVSLYSATKGPIIFKTMTDLNILPVSVTGMEMAAVPGKGMRAFLRLRAPFPMNEEIGLLRFYINHLNDYNASMRIFYFLKLHLRRIGVFFESKVAENAPGKECGISYGPGYKDLDEVIAHPLQQERMFFHFPNQELFLNINVPQPDRNWEQFILIFDLGQDWPKELRLNKELFQLFAVPVINLHKADAQPFICDGTREKYPVRHNDQNMGFEFHSVQGVYKIDETGMKPVKASIIYGENESYEIETDIRQTGENDPYLTLHYPGAFQSPASFLVNALWVQPGISEMLSEVIRVELYNRSITGVKWGLLGEMVPQSGSSFLDEMDDFMHLLTIKNKSLLTHDDVTCILRIIGRSQQNGFNKILTLFSDLRIEESSETDGSRPGMLKLVYILIFKNITPAILPLIDTFAEHVENILDAWISGAKIEVKTELIQTQENET